mmetsp:Transcript_19527/g.45412  ORF Transcript_19527/g.45412 Transcript_19527/m.45412 type:complete len:114 (-) Transcript_19527:1131-1472(-)
MMQTLYASASLYKRTEFLDGVGESSASPSMIVLPTPKSCFVRVTALDTRSSCGKDSKSAPIWQLNEVGASGNSTMPPLSVPCADAELPHGLCGTACSEMSFEVWSRHELGKLA